MFGKVSKKLYDLSLLCKLKPPATSPSTSTSTSGKNNYLLPLLLDLKIKYVRLSSTKHGPKEDNDNNGIKVLALWRLNEAEILTEYFLSTNQCYDLMNKNNTGIKSEIKPIIFNSNICEPEINIRNTKNQLLSIEILEVRKKFCFCNLFLNIIYMIYIFFIIIFLLYR